MKGRPCGCLFICLRGRIFSVDAVPFRRSDFDFAVLLQACLCNIVCKRRFLSLQTARRCTVKPVSAFCFQEGRLSCRGTKAKPAAGEAGHFVLYVILKYERRSFPLLSVSRPHAFEGWFSERDLNII